MNGFQIILNTCLESKEYGAKLRYKAIPGAPWAPKGTATCSAYLSLLISGHFWTPLDSRFLPFSILLFNIFDSTARPDSHHRAHTIYIYIYIHMYVSMHIYIYICIMCISPGYAFCPAPTRDLISLMRPSTEGLCNLMRPSNAAFD